VDSVCNDIDPKKDKEQGFERMPHKKKGDQKPTRSRRKRKRKRKIQTDKLQQTPILELSRRRKKTEICNDGDGGE